MLNKIIYKKCVILARNKKEFNIFCQNMLDIYEKGTEFFEGYEFIYYNGSNSVKGIRFDKILKYGKWELRDDIDFDALRAGLNGSFEECCRPYNDGYSIREIFQDYKEIDTE